MYQPSRGSSSGSQRNSRKEERLWDDEDGYGYNGNGRRDRSRSNERNQGYNVLRKDESLNATGDRRYSKKFTNRSNWSDSSSDDETVKPRHKTREYEYSHSTTNVPTREDELQIPLNLGTVHSTQKNDSSISGASKFSMQMQVKTPVSLGTTGGISIKLGGPPKPKQVITTGSTLVPKSTKVAAVFNADDDDEPEEMPAECKMRMKNVGRETPTSAGPNSFGKTKIGFCNVTHITEKKWEEETANKK